VTEPINRLPLKGSMKNILFLIPLFVAGFVSAQSVPPVPQPGKPTQTEEYRLKGVQNQVQAEFNRLSAPKIVLNSLLYLSTNNYDGIILVKTNATVLVHIGLPNPTNNLGRKYEITTMGASTAVLTNHYVTGTFTEINTMAEANSLTIASNKTAIAYSTGTNYVVRTY
jgi:hypothetical protein